jgi:hypothetical protein
LHTGYVETAARPEFCRDAERVSCGNAEQEGGYLFC